MMKRHMMMTTMMKMMVMMMTIMKRHMMMLLEVDQLVLPLHLLPCNWTLHLPINLVRTIIMLIRIINMIIVVRMAMFTGNQRHPLPEPENWIVLANTKFVVSVQLHSPFPRDLRIW